MEWFGRLGKFGWGKARHSMAGQVSWGKAWCGEVWCGLAGLGQAGVEL